jgi:hypothetical protein
MPTFYLLPPKQPLPPREQLAAAIKAQITKVPDD